jgi:crotonobetainyl-CoA:carnitine CoA-transferase CaiB-like acyl-CoA transferase
MADAEAALREAATRALGIERRAEARGRGFLASAYPVSALATAAVATAADAVARLTGAEHAEVDRALADAWFRQSLRPVGWALPSPWDPIAGDYPAADGWIRLHTNAPHHRAAALRVLGVDAERTAVAEAVARWRGEELEDAVVAAGGCAAVLHPPGEWARSAPGAAVAREPLVALERTAPGRREAWRPRPGRPLAGLRVLDLTRVLAGPVATRLLGGLGADVLRIDPPDWDEPGVVPEVTAGKRCARLDARTPEGRARLAELLAGADVLVSGYRDGALASLGLGRAERDRIRPGLVDVALTAYGWSGPWAGRRGFDSLVQMSAGIAATGMREAGADRPVPLPVQALDHATGWLMAAAALTGLADRVRDGGGTVARLSLARTAAELERVRTLDRPPSGPAPEALPDTPRATPWGEARLLAPPLEVAGAPLRFDVGPAPLGSAAPVWADPPA